jgi:hypothetical protein
MNGKGDSPRPTNMKVYRENYDAIDWSKPATCKESHLAFMRSQGFQCASEAEAYELRGLLDM